MHKEILCLKLNRNPGYTSDNLICVFNVNDHLNLSESEKELILDTIETKYSWILSELSITRDYIKRKLLDSKWRVLEYRNKDFKCTGRLSLSTIDYFGE